MSMRIINSCHAKQLSPKKGKYKMRKIEIGVGGGIVLNNSKSTLIKNKH